ncbi:hypothetical protein CEUSTIGMA_g5343.t1 [Chlamydomonas eustigma]|uniref:UspA domain-containing protein n=1 Tax=Chlamydomonas eustigma TaxID=1157962 RepID=A0A250X4A8_9CHLO|nr:hypothetical protein CEUSTIGMA_g5343.t1 [Chlamydomonas eustigma]|eukprot:GAX77901.1 hypothetical protein CEUSTIGMA_g5343.t1 [Chlamydomonas eustigma]
MQLCMRHNLSTVLHAICLYLLNSCSLSMGLGFSAPGWTDPDNDTTTGEWRSERYKELEKYGGITRPLVRRGLSFEKRMEWLQSKLSEQSSAFEEALAKDPFAGRHEIIEQEKEKAIKAAKLAMLEEEDRKKYQGYNKKKSSSGKETTGAQKAKRGLNDHDGVGSKSGKALDGHDEKSSKTKIEDYYKMLDLEQEKLEEGRKKKMKELARQKRQGVVLPEWRIRVMAAKRRAWLILGVIVRLQVQTKLSKMRGKPGKVVRLRRVDSFSFYIQNCLGEDFERFQEEMCRYHASVVMVESLRRLLMDMQEANRLRREAKIAKEMEEARLMSRPGTAMKSFFLSMDEQPISGSDEEVERSGGAGEEDEYEGPAARRGPRAPVRRVVGSSRMSSIFGNGMVAPSPPGTVRAGSSAPQIEIVPGENGLAIELPPMSVASGGPNSPGKLAPINPALIKGAMQKSTTANFLNRIETGVPSVSSNGSSAAGSPAPSPPRRLLPSDSMRQLRPPGSSLVVPNPPSNMLRPPGVVPPPPRPMGSGWPGSGGKGGSSGWPGGLPPPRISFSAPIPPYFGPPVTALVQQVLDKSANKESGGGWNEDEEQKPVKLTKELKRKKIEDEAREAERKRDNDFERAKEKEESDMLQKIGDEVSNMEKTLQIMGVYAHRCNAQWCESLKWDIPQVHSLAGFTSQAGGGQAGMFRKDVLKMLQTGVFAFQVIASEDYVRISRVYAAESLWGTDPWSVIISALPNKASSVEHVEGMPLGPRAMLSIVNAVEELGGTEAVDNLMIVLHCNNEQEEDVIATLRARNCFGLKRENLLVCVERRNPSYNFDTEQRRFVKKLGTEGQQVGSGYNLMQLAYTGEAFVLASEEEIAVMEEEAAAAAAALEIGTAVKKKEKEQASGWFTPGTELRPIFQGRKFLYGSALDYLIAKGAVWLMTRRLNDLGMYSSENMLDLDSLAFTAFLADQQGANMFIHVDSLNSFSFVGVDGLVLSQHEGPEAERCKRTPQHAVEIKTYDLMTPNMTILTEELRIKNKGKMVCSTNRYTTSLKHLKKIMISPQIFKPSLENTPQGLLRVVLSMADITAHELTKCLAMTNREIAKFFCDIGDAEDLYSVIVEQDHNATFRKMIGNLMYSSGLKALWGRLPGKKITAPKIVPASKVDRSIAARMQSGDIGNKSVSKEGEEDDAPRRVEEDGKKVVLLVADNAATKLGAQLILGLLNAAKDVVYLLTVATVQQEEEAREICAQYETIVKGCLCKAEVVVLKKGSESLVQHIDDYVENIGADLVVIGSKTLSKGNSSIPVASMTIGILKKLKKPILVVKSTSKNAVIQWDRDKIKAMVLVDATCRPMVLYVCSKLLNAARRDKIFLARTNTVDSANKETTSTRRLFKSCIDIASSKEIGAIKKPLDGSFEDEGCKIADVEEIQIMAVQAFPGQPVQPFIFKLLTHSKSAVLVYKGPPQ